jgi:flagellar motor switch protein FliG
MIDRVMRAFQSNAGFASLERADPQQLSKFILGEHPQTIALILAHLQPANAAQLATLLPRSCASRCSRAWPASKTSRPTSCRGSRA